jgi:hypothetical protein
MRINSSVDYRAASATASKDFGDVVAGQPAPSDQMIFTSAAVAFTKASIGGEDPSAFTINGDTCSGRTVASGQSCQLTVTPQPSATGSQAGILSIPNNSLTPVEAVNLTVNGVKSTKGTPTRRSRPAAFLTRR